MSKRKNQRPGRSSQRRVIAIQTAGPTAPGSYRNVIPTVRGGRGKGQPPKIDIQSMKPRDFKNEISKALLRAIQRKQKEEAKAKEQKGDRQM